LFIVFSHFAALNLVQIERLVDSLSSDIEEFLSEESSSSFLTASLSIDTVALFDLPGLRLDLLT
jgi:histidine ammonia-lyase